MKLTPVPRTAKRQWRVDPDDGERLARSLAAVELIGRYIGGEVQVASPTEDEPWVFEWHDTSDEDSPAPQWVVRIDEDELFEESLAAAELVTEFIGGVVSIGAIRDEEHDYATVGRAFQWKSYLPALRAVEQKREPVPEPEPIAG